MFVSQPDSLAGILPAVISGGRPGLAERPVRKFLSSLHGVTADPVWIVRDDQAAGYERDEHEIVTYERGWAYEYASQHWTGLEPLQPDGFTGAFPGREHACRVAEQRGHWGVLQLDDNVARLGFVNSWKASRELVEREGSLAFYADVLAAITTSTNGRMVGARLNAVTPESLKVCRPGFPYSLFLERVGPGRESWIGPFEDDITHAYQYAYNESDATALLAPTLTYLKESASSSGMRAHYRHDRAAGLQRMFPESAKIGVRQTRSNGLGEPRVFHTMLPGAIRNRTPMIITDDVLFAGVKSYLTGLFAEWYPAIQAGIRRRVLARAAAAADD